MNNNENIYEIKYRNYYIIYISKDIYVIK